jgi:hypothetical protein
VSVERNKDGSVSISTKNGAVVVGKIMPPSDNGLKERYEKWVETCVNLVTPGIHSFKETERYFLSKCDTLPLNLDNIHLRSYKRSIIMNYFKDKLEHKVPDFSFDMTEEQMEKWYEASNAIHKEAMSSPPERFELNMRGYFLPGTEKNKILYEETYLEMQQHMLNSDDKHRHVEMANIFFFFEETTEDIQASGGGSGLINQLIIFRGISQEDIDKRTPKFLAYISALRDIGKLPDFR